MKRQIAMILGLLLLTGCAGHTDSGVTPSTTDILSQEPIYSSEATQPILSDEEVIQQQIAEFGDRYTPKYEAKFGPYTPEKEKQIRERIPIKAVTDPHLEELYYQYFLDRSKTLPGNPTEWENTDWIRSFGREHVHYVGSYKLGLVLTILEPADVKVDNSYRFFYKARVEKAFACDVKPGNIITVYQDLSGAPGPVSFNYMPFQAGQKITMLSFKTNVDLEDGGKVEAYYAMFDKILYHETIYGEEYVLDLMNWNVVEAAYFFDKAQKEGDAFKCYCGGGVTLGLLRPEVVEGILTELL